MKIGCLKEIKDNEFRVGLTPSSAKMYISQGHSVFIESNAGLDSGFSNEAYESVGASVVKKGVIVDNCQMIIKVKEPLASEYEYFKEGQILYTYLHLAANKELTNILMQKKVTAIAYETIKEASEHPCLAPMSRIAGRLSITESAKYIQKSYGGKGILLGGVTGVNKAKVVILGGGVVGINAAQMALGLGAEVIVLDIDTNRLEYIDHIFNMKVTTLVSTRESLLEILPSVDILIGAVLVSGHCAPKLIKKSDLLLMQKGSVIVDVAIDQGGCFETSRPTTYSDPVFIVDGIVHYCVANMPGNVSRTSTIALNNATTKYGQLIASLDMKSLLNNEALAQGFNTFKGHCVNKAVAHSLDLEYTCLKDLI